MRGRRLLVAAVLGATALGPVTARAGDEAAPCDWPMFGHDPAHTGEAAAGCTTIDSANAASLVPKWFFRANDSVTASPAVDASSVYVGAWDGTFYALARADGRPRWTFDVDTVDHNRSAFGRIVSSAALATFAGRKVVIFGGGASVFVLDAADGRLLASRDLDPDPAAAEHVAEVESSPVVVGRDVYVGLDVHNARGAGRTGVVKLRLEPNATDAWTLTPVWKFDPETGRARYGVAGLTEDAGGGFGCGGVWASPAFTTTPEAPHGLIVFGTSSCSHAEEAKAAGENFIESVFAVDAMTGRPRWVFRPSTDPGDAAGDFDFGSSPNLYHDRRGRHLVGNGRKSGDYYALDVATGAPAWTSHAAQPGWAEDGFAVGGFIGTPAVRTDPRSGRATAIVGVSAIPIPLTWDVIGNRRVPHDAASQADQSTWAARALDPATGEVLWQYRLGGPSYGHTAISRDVALIPETFDFRLTVLDTATGLPLATLPLAGPPSSTPVPADCNVYLGVGTRTTDVEWKAAGDELQQAFAGTPLAPSPLSPLSGVYAFETAGGCEPAPAWDSQVWRSK